MNESEFMDKNNQKINDAKLTEFLRKELPEARKDQWFTNKVLNRLPPHNPQTSIVEKWIMLILVICVTIGLIFQSVHIATANVILVSDFVLMGLFLFSFLFLGVWIVWPRVRN